MADYQKAWTDIRKNENPPDPFKLIEVILKDPRMAKLNITSNSIVRSRGEKVIYTLQCSKFIDGKGKVKDYRCIQPAFKVGNGDYPRVIKDEQGNNNPICAKCIKHFKNKDETLKQGDSSEFGAIAFMPGSPDDNFEDLTDERIEALIAEHQTREETKKINKEKKAKGGPESKDLQQAAIEAVMEPTNKNENPSKENDEENDPPIPTAPVVTKNIKKDTPVTVKDEDPKPKPNGVKRIPNK